MSFQLMLTQSATVSSLSVAQNDMGGSDKTFAIRMSALPCLVQAKRLNEVNEFGKVGVRNNWRLYCEANSANRAIAVSDRVLHSSNTYEVRGVYNVSNRDKLMHIDLEHIE